MSEAGGVTVLDVEGLQKHYPIRSGLLQRETGRVRAVVGQSPAYMGTRIVRDRLENVPDRTCTSQHCRTPWGGHPEQWYFR